MLTWGDDDGDPSSVTEAGEVWKLTGVKTATNPAGVTRTKIAEGLKEPQGIKVVDGDIYVSEKHRLTRLVDADGDGVYEGKTRSRRGRSTATSTSSRSACSTRTASST